MARLSRPIDGWLNAKMIYPHPDTNLVTTSLTCATPLPLYQTATVARFVPYYQCFDISNKTKCMIAIERRFFSLSLWFRLGYSERPISVSLPVCVSVKSHCCGCSGGQMRRLLDKYSIERFAWSDKNVQRRETGSGLRVSDVPM